MNDDPSLLLHLSGAALAGEALRDSSSHEQHVPLAAGVRLCSDAQFGRAVEFTEAHDGLATPLAEPPATALTVAAWLRFDPESPPLQPAILWRLAGLLPWNGQPGTACQLSLNADTLSIQLGPQQFTHGVSLDTTGSWHHVVLTWDGQSNGLRLYVDGEFQAEWATEVGILYHAGGAEALTLGRGAADEDGAVPSGEPFVGRLAGFRLYERPLDADEVTAIWRNERDYQPLPFDTVHPLSFRVSDSQGRARIYILDEASQGQTLHLIFANAGPLPIEFPAAPATRDGRAPLVGARPAQSRRHHLEIVFRPGVLDPATLQRITPADTDWLIGYEIHADRTVSLFLYRQDGFVLPSQGVMTISLLHVKALIRGGSRPSQLELRYRELRYVGEADVLAGHRLTHVEIVNQRGLTTPPLVAGFVGSHTILNDGHTLNELTLYLGNPAPEPLPFTARDTRRRPRLVLSFDTGYRDSWEEPWALAHADELAEIDIESLHPDWHVIEVDDGEAPEWIIEPRGRELAASDWVTFRLRNLKTQFPSGIAHLYLRYHDFPGYRDGQLTVAVEKAPRLYREFPVSVTTRGTGPEQGRETLRRVAAVSGSLVVGERFTAAAACGREVPPAQGLVVEGAVGIGTATPEVGLDVHTSSVFRQEAILAGGAVIRQGLQVDGPAQWNGEVRLHNTVTLPVPQPVQLVADESQGLTVYRDSPTQLSIRRPGSATGLDFHAGRNKSSLRFLKYQQEHAGVIFDGQSLRIGFLSKGPDIDPDQASLGSNSLTVEIGGRLTVRDTLKGKTIEDQHGPLVPIGAVIFWDPQRAIPPGWAICNGQTVNGQALPNVSSQLGWFPWSSSLIAIMRIY